MGFISDTKTHFFLISFLMTLQVLLDDVKVSEQLLDLVFYLLVVLSVCKQVCLILPFEVLLPLLFMFTGTCFHNVGKP